MHVIGRGTPRYGSYAQIAGHVIRHTEDGFAIQNERPHPDIYRLVVDEPAALTHAEADSLTEAAAGSGEGAAQGQTSAVLMSRRDGLEPTENLQGLPDVEKIRPFIFAPATRSYHAVGQVLGKAFSIGKEI